MRMLAPLTEARRSRPAPVHATVWERLVASLQREGADRRPLDASDFEEPFTGLHTREIDEPELFSHLFGRTAA